MEDSKRSNIDDDTKSIKTQKDSVLEEYNLKETRRMFDEHVASAQSVVAAAQFLERSISEQIEFGKFRYLSIHAFKGFVRRRFCLTCGIVTTHIAQFNARFTDRERVLRSGSSASVSLLRKTRIDPDIQAWLAERIPRLARFRAPSTPLSASSSVASADEDSPNRTRMYLSDLIPIRRYEQRFHDLFEEHGKYNIKPFIIIVITRLLLIKYSFRYLLNQYLF